MLSRSSARLCLAIQSHMPEAEKRAIVLGAMHNYEMAVVDTIGDFAFDLAAPAAKPSVRDAQTLTDAVRTFANHAAAMGKILEGRAFPPQFDLSGVRISSSMARAAMPQVNLEAATVCGGGSFAHAIMPGANLRSGSFQNICFTNAVLQKSQLNSAKFHGCDFSGCDMSGVDCRDAMFFRCVFRRANLKDIVANAQTAFLYPTGSQWFTKHIMGNPKVIMPPPAG